MPNLNQNPNLSEETRSQTITVINKVYDLHITNNLYYICEHGTYSIVATMTEEFYNLITE